MKKKLWRLPAALLILALLGGCTKNPGEPTAAGEGEAYHKITVEQAKEKMDGGGVTIVDVRRQDEYEEKHIPGALLVPNGSIGEEAPAQLPDKGATLLVYCRTGVRSEQASKKLVELGYTAVYDFGGINDWPYDTVSGGEPGEMPSAAAEPLLGSFTAQDLEGNQVDQSILAGKKLTMVNVWATFCGPCLQEMPELGELSAEYSDKDFQIVGIVIDVIGSDGAISDSQVAKARTAVEKTGADYLHLLPSQDLIDAKLKDVSAVPETFFVDEAGNLVGESYLGSRPKKAWQTIIDEKLEEVTK